MYIYTYMRVCILLEEYVGDRGLTFLPYFCLLPVFLRVLNQNVNTSANPEDYA